MAVREEIISGLKNAMARGESLEKASQSFINAGYNQDDVQAAAEELKASGGMGVLSQMHLPEHELHIAEQNEHAEESETGQAQENQNLQYPPLPEQNEQNFQQQPQQMQQAVAAPKKSKTLKIAILIIILLMLLTLAGIAVFGTEILDALFK